MKSLDETSNRPTLIKRSPPPLRNPVTPTQWTSTQSKSLSSPLKNESAARKKDSAFIAENLVTLVTPAPPFPLNQRNLLSKEYNGSKKKPQP